MKRITAKHCAELRPYLPVSPLVKSGVLERLFAALWSRQVTAKQ